MKKNLLIVLVLLCMLVTPFNVLSETLTVYDFLGHELLLVKDDTAITIMSMEDYRSVLSETISTTLENLSLHEGIGKFYILIEDKPVVFLYDTSSDVTLPIRLSIPKLHELPSEGRPDEDGNFEIFSPLPPDIYRVSYDLPDGNYLLFSDSNDAYFALLKDSTGDPESALVMESIDGQRYISLSSYDYNHDIYFEFIGARAYPSLAAPRSTPIGNPTRGMYLVGKDIPAGEYTLKGNSELSSYTIYNDVSYLNNDEIETFDYVSDHKNIILRDGQYISLHNVELIID